MKIIGHRGARGLAPENTIAALKKGLEHRVDELEFDLRVTRDGQIILHHDKKLTDPNGNTHLIRNHSFDELQRHKPDLALLTEALSAAGNTKLQLEVKPGEPVQPIVKALSEVNTEQVLIGSKSQKTLLALHEALPNIRKIVIHPWSGLIATRRAKQLDTKLISMNQLWLWRGFIGPMARRGWKLSAYTLNDPAKARRWQKYGLYGVITDYPDRFEKR